MKVVTYLGNIMGLPKLKRLGTNTRVGTPRFHVYKVTIQNSEYFKVHFHRSDRSVIKYFKKKKEAKAFVNALKKVST